MNDTATIWRECYGTSNNCNTIVEGKEILRMIYDSITNTLVHLSTHTKECTNVTLQ